MRTMLLRFFIRISLLIIFLFSAPVFSVWAEEAPAAQKASFQGTYEGPVMFRQGGVNTAPGPDDFERYTSAIVEVKESKPDIYSVEGYVLYFKEDFKKMEATFRIAGTYRLDNNEFKGIMTQIKNGRENNADGKFVVESSNKEDAGYFLIALPDLNYAFELRRADPLSMTSELQKGQTPSITIESPAIDPSARRQINRQP